MVARRKRNVVSSICFAGGLVLAVAGAMAEVGSWVYITPFAKQADPITGHNAWILPPTNSQGPWTPVASLSFDQVSDSDLELRGEVYFAENNLPDASIYFEFKVDGVEVGSFFARTPEDFPSDYTFALSGPPLHNRSSGPREITLLAKNVSGAPIYIRYAVISAMAVDENNSACWDLTVPSTIVGSTWVVLADIEELDPEPECFSTSPEMAILRAYLQILSGSPNARLELRFRRGKAQIGISESGTLDAYPDGIHLAAMDSSASLGSRPYTLEARVISGTSVTINAGRLVAQLMPEYTMFEGNVFGATVPNNDLWHTIASTGWMSLEPISLGGPNGLTDGAGFASLGFLNASQGEVDVALCFEPRGGPWHFDLGWTAFAPKATATYDVASWPSTWETLGLVNEEEYRLRLRVRGRCNNQPNLEISNGYFNVLALPSKGYACFTCGVGACTCLSPGDLGVTSTTVPVASCFADGQNPCEDTSDL